jgi:DNA-binding IclR family transcriptional regulator
MIRKTQSIEKALKILLSFSPENTERGTIEISQITDMNKATTSRIVNTLDDYGFLARDPQTKKFRLGNSIVKLGLAVNRSINRNLVFVAKPFVDQLRNETGESVVFNILSGKDFIVSYIADNPRTLRLSLELGQTLPLPNGASGKVLCAFMPDIFIEGLLARNLKAFTPHTITDPVELRELFKTIKMQGYAFDNEEVEIGYNAIAAPVFNHENKPIAAIALVGLLKGMDYHNGSPLIPVLKKTAREISNRLYYLEPAIEDRKKIN